MTSRTSHSHPIRVDWLEQGLPGKVGLTFAPGKHASSYDGGEDWARDLEMDLDRLVVDFGMSMQVCLLLDGELGHLGIPGLVDAATRRGVEVLRLPIPDGGVLPGAAPVRRVVDRIRQAAQSGRNVVIHCRGGLGRAGTVGGCFLVDQGLSADEALARLRHCRGPNCPETHGQRQFIRAYARRRDGVSGAVLGAAIGDAMGHPTEFLGMAEIRQKWGAQGVQGFELYWERLGRRFAPYTDDTQMAEAVLRALVDGRREGLDLDGTMRLMSARFVEWASHPQGGHRAPGNACLTGCRALAAGVPWAEAGAPEAGGCGSVMRAWPFGLLFADDLEKAESWAVAHSRLTHRHPIALAACGAMAVGVAMSLGGAEVPDTIEAMVAAAARQDPGTAEMMRRAADEASEGVGPELTLDRNRGWAAHEAISAASYLLVRHGEDARAAILCGANTPGDSDSIATLGGALVGARVGIGGLPAAWVRDVERGEELRALAVEASR